MSGELTGEALLTALEVTADELDDPEFDHATRVHDWRNYVPESVRALWPRLPLVARIVAYACAEEGASAEEWD